MRRLRTRAGIINSRYYSPPLPSSCRGVIDEQLTDRFRDRFPSLQRDLIEDARTRETMYMLVGSL